MNKVDLVQIFAIFGITGTILMTAIGFLIKSIIGHFLNKDFEAFKIKLQEESEIEKMKFSVLQEKRALIIAELYSLLALFNKSAISLMAPLQLAGSLSENEKAKIVASDANNFIDYYQQHKIFFDKKTCLLIDEINEKFKIAWIDFQYRDKIVREKNGVDLWTSSWKTISEEIPLIQEGIGDVFREILGIKNNI